MTRREREAEQRRSDIVQAARTLFVRDGFINTGMDQVAQSAEFSRKTLYKYFRSKLDLLVVVAMGTLSDFTAALTGTAGLDDPPDRSGQLRRYCRFYLEWYRSRPGDFALISWYDIAVHNEASRLSPEVMRELEGWRKQYPPVVETILGEGIRSGEFRGDLDPDLAAEFFHKALYGIAHQYVLHPRFPETHFHTEIDYLMRAFERS